MDLPTPPQAVVALASFVRHRLAEVGDTLSPLLARRGESAVATPGEAEARSTAELLRFVDMLTASQNSTRPSL